MDFYLVQLILNKIRENHSPSHGSSQKLLQSSLEKGYIVRLLLAVLLMA
jgi:hypothetical protein